MKNQITTILFLLISTCLFSQINGIVIDSVTKAKIPYVNIWVENENEGTTSNENGEFYIEKVDNQKTLVFSSIGYETKHFDIYNIPKTIELNPKIYELKEVVIRSKKEKNEKIIGEFSKSEIYQYFGCGKAPWIVARFFPFAEIYNQTPYIKKIRVLTKSEVKDSRFNIRLYSVNESGEPENYIYDRNIIGIAGKGKRITEIDISNLNIRFPEKGFFIAIEWLIIEQNKYLYDYTMLDSKEKLNGISFEPVIGTVARETNENSWIYVKGKWGKVQKNHSSYIKDEYNDKYSLLAIELTLTN